MMKLKPLETTVDIPDPNWTQAQLSPSMGGFGLRSLSGLSSPLWLLQGLIILITFTCSRQLPVSTPRCLPRMLSQLRRYLLLLHLKVACLRRWVGSLFNLYCPPPKLIRHVYFQFQPPLQVLGYLLFSPQV